MGSLPVVLLLCSFHGTAAKQNTQIILFNYGWVAVCLFLCCETLPSCGFCSTALTAVAQDQQAGNALLLISHTSHQDKLSCMTSVCLWVIAMGHWLDVFPVWLCFLFLFLESTQAPGGTLPASEWQIRDDLWTDSQEAPRNCWHNVLCASSCHCDRCNFNLYLLSLQTVGRRCILAPGCTRFTGPSSDVLVLCASTGDLKCSCRNGFYRLAVKCVSAWHHPWLFLGHTWSSAEIRSGRSTQNIKAVTPQCENTPWQVELLPS